MPFSRGSSQPRDWTHVSYISCIGRRFFTTSATWEALKGLLSYSEVIELTYEVIKMGFPDGSDSKESACNEGDLLQSLGQEDPVDEGMATHSSIFAWRIPMDRD